MSSVDVIWWRVIDSVSLVKLILWLMRLIDICSSLSSCECGTVTGQTQISTVIYHSTIDSSTNSVRVFLGICCIMLFFGQFNKYPTSCLGQWSAIQWVSKHVKAIDSIPKTQWQLCIFILNPNLYSKMFQLFLLSEHFTCFLCFLSIQLQTFSKRCLKSIIKQ